MSLIFGVSIITTPPKTDRTIIRMGTVSTGSAKKLRSPMLSSVAAKTILYIRSYLSARCRSSSCILLTRIEMYIVMNATPAKNKIGNGLKDIRSFQKTSMYWKKNQLQQNHRMPAVKIFMYTMSLFESHRFFAVVFPII